MLRNRFAGYAPPGAGLPAPRPPCTIAPASCRRGSVRGSLGGPCRPGSRMGHQPIHHKLHIPVSKEDVLKGSF
eukprot:487630-Pelagomonas_calceolata.AAC.10